MDFSSFEDTALYFEGTGADLASLRDLIRPLRCLIRLFFLFLILIFSLRGRSMSVELVDLSSSSSAKAIITGDRFNNSGLV